MLTKGQLADIIQHAELQYPGLPQSVTPAAVFAFAEWLCARGYDEQRVPASDDRAEDRDAERQAREQRKVTGFERLYCQIRDMADDFHHEAIRRRDGIERGLFSAAMLDPELSIANTFELVHDRVADWDY